MPNSTNPGHLTKLLSSESLGAFMAMVGRRTQDPLTDQQCNAVHQWLVTLTDLASSFPDGDLHCRTVYKRCQCLADEYKEWNAVGATSGHREKHRRKLNKLVNKVATSYRKRIKILERELDIDTYARFKHATVGLYEAIPDVIPELARVLKGY